MTPRERPNEGLRNVDIPERLRDDAHDEAASDEELAEDSVETDEVLEAEDWDEDGEPTEEELAEEEALEAEERAEAVAADGGRGTRRFSLRAALRLYRGQTSFDFVGRRRWWFAVSGLIIVAGLVSFSIRGFNFGIDFRGGTAWEITATNLSQAKVTSAVEAAGLTQPTVEVLGGKTIQVQADLTSLSAAQRTNVENKVTAALQRLAPNQEPSITTVGPTWGGQVTQHALIALIAFFVTVGIYISLRFEPKMAMAAFVALVHDLLVTAGVYSILGFQVTPDTVVAILTILGYSLYDTVVVFDRVRDNTRGLGSSGRMTYTEMVNLSMNQTLARSINTSLVAILPVFAVLVIGAEILGAVTLQYYGLALFIGLLSGAYSSIFIASPILAMMKEREQRYTVIRQRLAARGERLGVLTPAAAAQLAVGTSGSSRQPIGARMARTGPLRPGAALPKAPTATRSSAAAGEGGNGTPPGGPARTGGGAQRRPPPRPRKGAKRGGKKRR